ncbi:hypothetical protein vBKpnPMUC100_048 [Klebsiella phage vB_KpnP_MUC100]|uniref:Uncharacterized protein n=1 Tax=Klebsiella phage vB_KpnP_MUC100 TaxID=3065244 RepID=A0AAX4G493_9CAUD|nr:hypothetical protein vBKpnPMUC100_048 [Klebsiella phage vB_KpnP_MUC100]
MVVACPAVSLGRVPPATPVPALSVSGTAKRDTYRLSKCDLLTVTAKR